MLGLKWKHVNLDAATMKVDQRVWHQNEGCPKSEDSRCTLGVGDLVERYCANSPAWGRIPSDAPTSPSGTGSARAPSRRRKIAGHGDLVTTGEYTFVAPERQNELTRRIQQRLAKAGKTREAVTLSLPPELPRTACDGQDPAPLATTLIQ